MIILSLYYNLIKEITMPKGTKYDIEFKKMIADLFNSKQMTMLR